MHASVVLLETDLQVRLACAVLQTLKMLGFHPDAVAIGVQDMTNIAMVTVTHGGRELGISLGLDQLHDFGARWNRLSAGIKDGHVTMDALSDVLQSVAASGTVIQNLVRILVDEDFVGPSEDGSFRPTSVRPESMN